MHWPRRIYTCLPLHLGRYHGLYYPTTACLLHTLLHVWVMLIMLSDIMDCIIQLPRVLYIYAFSYLNRVHDVNRYHGLYYPTSGCLIYMLLHVWVMLIILMCCSIFVLCIKLNIRITSLIMKLKKGHLVRGIPTLNFLSHFTIIKISKGLLKNSVFVSKWVTRYSVQDFLETILRLWMSRDKTSNKRTPGQIVKAFFYFFKIQRPPLLLGQTLFQPDVH